jgi:hypothetical protein
MRLAHDLQRTGAVREATEITSFDQSRYEAMDARLRPQIECASHLVERRRDAMRLHELTDKLQQLPLALRQHANLPVELRAQD